MLHRTWYSCEVRWQLPKDDRNSTPSPSLPLSLHTPRSRRSLRSLRVELKSSPLVGPQNDGHDCANPFGEVSRHQTCSFHSTKAKLTLPSTRLLKYPSSFTFRSYGHLIAKNSRCSINEDGHHVSERNHSIAPHYPLDLRDRSLRFAPATTGLLCRIVVKEI